MRVRQIPFSGRRSNGALMKPFSRIQNECMPRIILSMSSSSFASDSSTILLPSYSFLRPPTEPDVQHFQAVMNHRDGGVLTDREDIRPYNHDWTKHYQGNSSVVLRPKTTEEVSAILQHCHNERIGVVPQSGNTGLVGGSVPTDVQEVVMSLKGMNQIDWLDESNGILQCEAGCILQDLQSYAADRGFMVPIDLGAKGTCLIGGNVSTNAGGQYFYRHGSLHANVLGLEVVLADGRILNMLSKNLKDNTGYDMKHLFIGAEGTLGIITKVNLLCPPMPTTRNTAFVACPNFVAVLKTLSLAKALLGEVLAAFEILDEAILDVLEQRGSKSIPVSSFEGGNYPYCLLIETQGSVESHDNDKLDQFLEHAMMEEYVVDGVVAQDLSQLDEMWEIRESCNPTIATIGYVYKYDISLPVTEFADFIDEMRQRVSQRSVIAGSWGHVMDGNLHFNVVQPGVYEKDTELLDLIEPFIFQSVQRRGGSISAEHGLGQAKNKYLTGVKGTATVALMGSLKNLFDPHGILNPKKYLPVTTQA